MVFNWLSFEPSNVKIGLSVTEMSGWPKLGTLLVSDNLWTTELTYGSSRSDMFFFGGGAGFELAISLIFSHISLPTDRPWVVDTFVHP